MPAKAISSMDATSWKWTTKATPTDSPSPGFPEMSRKRFKPAISPTRTQSLTHVKSRLFCPIGATEIVTFGAGVTPTLRLDLKAQKGLKSGQALVIQVLEAATKSGEATEIDRFRPRGPTGRHLGVPDVVDPRPSTHPVRGSYHLADHFQLEFAGAEGAQVCILSELGSGVSRPAYISVKAIAKDRPLESSCTAQRVMVVRHFRARLMAYQFRKG